MKKVLVFLVCLMCLFTVGCQKNVDTKVNRDQENIKTSGENLPQNDATYNDYFCGKVEEASNILVEELVNKDDFNEFYKNSNYLHENNIMVFEGNYFSDNQNNVISLKFLECPYFDLASQEFELRINDKSEKIYSPISLLGLYIVDLDADDAYREIAIVDPSGAETYYVTFYRFKDDEIFCLGSIDIGSYFYNGINSDSICRIDDKIITLDHTINVEEGLLYFNYYIVENDTLVEKSISKDALNHIEYLVSTETLNEFLLSGDNKKFEEIGEVPLKVGEKIKVLDYLITSSLDSVVMVKVENENGDVYCIGHLIGSQS